MTQELPPVQLREGTMCQYEGCLALAEDVACGRDKHPQPALYCKTHAHEVAYEERPEYVQTCPNCGCMFGVN